MSRQSVVTSGGGDAGGGAERDGATAWGTGPDVGAAQQASRKNGAIARKLRMGRLPPPGFGRGHS